MKVEVICRKFECRNWFRSYNVYLYDTRISYTYLCRSSILWLVSVRKISCWVKWKCQSKLASKVQSQDLPMITACFAVPKPFGWTFGRLCSSLFKSLKPLASSKSVSTIATPKARMLIRISLKFLEDASKNKVIQTRRFECLTASGGLWCEILTLLVTRRWRRCSVTFQNKTDEGHMSEPVPD